MISGHVRDPCDRMGGARQSRLLVQGVDVGHEHAPSADARSRVEAYTPSRPGWPRPALIIYSLTAGTAAVLVGAAVSLIAPGPQRLTLWATATGVVAVAAGVARDSRLLTCCCRACGRFLRRLAKLSPIS